MEVRYCIDPRTGLPHIYKHDVAEVEFEDVLESPGEDRAGRDGCRIAVGCTSVGRLLRVIWVATMKQNKCPPGWDEKRVERVVKHYESQSAAEALAEDEARAEERSGVLMRIPRDLVAAVRELIAKHKKGA
jgi:hypothetical protein